jgi:hypothetical protein
LNYRLLDAFRGTFKDVPYIHRNPTHGDRIAMHLFEDLLDLDRSSKLKTRIANREVVLNSQNMRKGVKARRGDGTLGELVPHANAIQDPGFSVARGKIANIEIGIEVKILAKAMIKQIDRVMTDLREQAANFRKGLGSPICIGIVGVNHSKVCTSYEGDRSYTFFNRSIF